MTRSDEQAVLGHFFAAQEAMDLEGVVACWCDDARMATPFAPPPMPREHVGIDAIRRTFGALFSGAERIEITDVVPVRTEKTGFWFATWAFAITLHTDSVFSGHDAGTFLLRDGRIAEYVEYFDALECARSFGISLT